MRLKVSCAYAGEKHVLLLQWLGPVTPPTRTMESCNVNVLNFFCGELNIECSVHNSKYWLAFLPLLRDINNKLLISTKGSNFHCFVSWCELFNSTVVLSTYWYCDYCGPVVTLVSSLSCTVMYCISLVILSRLSWFASPAVGTHWPFCVDVLLNTQSIIHACEFSVW